MKSLQTDTVTVFSIVVVLVLIGILIGWGLGRSTTPTNKVEVVEPVNVRVEETSPGIQERFMQIERDIKLLNDILNAFMTEHGGV